MPYYLLSSLLWRLFDNPVPALVLVLLAYLLLDRRYIGLLPDLARPWRRRRRQAHLAEIVALNPADANSQLELGALHLEGGRPDRGLPILEKARARMEDSARLHYLLGACYQRLGRDAEAREALDKAIALNPKVAYGEPYHHLLILALRENPRDEERLALLRDQILRHGTVPLFYRAGRAFLRAGDRGGARAMFHEAVMNYRALPKGYRRANRRWAAASWLFLRFCRFNTLGVLAFTAFFTVLIALQRNLLANDLNLGPPAG